MKKTVIALGLAVVVLLGITYVYAGGPGFGPGKGPGNCAGGCGGLNLTSEQQTKMKEMHQQHYDEVAPLREKMFSLRQELRTLWSDPKANSGVIQEKTKEMNDLRNQMQEKMVEFRLEARNLLTPEQIEAMGAGCGQGPGRGPGRGPGQGRGRF
jgi:Spy/CpxP family protein refolding chaperone